MTAPFGTITRSSAGPDVHIDEHASGIVEINVEGMPSILVDSTKTASTLCDALCQFFAEKQAIAQYEEHETHAHLPLHSLS